MLQLKHLYKVKTTLSIV